MELFKIISAYPKLSMAILSPVLLCIGYFFRLRVEKKKNLKGALYILLEIWHRLSVFYRNDFSGVYDQVFSQIQKLFPNQEIPKEMLDSTKKQFSPMLNNLSRNVALVGLKDYARTQW